MEIRTTVAAGSGQGAAGGEFAFEVDAGAEVDRRHAERLGGADIGGQIVDEQEVLGGQAHALDEDLVDARGPA